METLVATRFIKLESEASVQFHIKLLNLGKSSKRNFLFPELILLKLGLANIRQHSELLRQGNIIKKGFLEREEGNSKEAESRGPFREGDLPWVSPPLDQ